MAKIQKKSKQQFHLIPFFYFPPKDCPSGSHQTIFPQNPTQPNHLCVSVRICGRLFSARSFCVFCEFRGRTLRSHQTIFPTEFAEHRNNRWGISSHRLHRCAQIRRVWHPCHTHVATKLSSHRIHGIHSKFAEESN